VHLKLWRGWQRSSRWLALLLLQMGMRFNNNGGPWEATPPAAVVERRSSLEATPPTVTVEGRRAVVYSGRMAAHVARWEEPMACSGGGLTGPSGLVPRRRREKLRTQLQSSIDPWGPCCINQGLVCNFYFCRGPAVCCSKHRGPSTSRPILCYKKKAARYSWLDSSSRPYSSALVLS
jgi:hypothetical protein